MSLIEQAAKRLEQLRQMGVEIPESTLGKPKEDQPTANHSTAQQGTTPVMASAAATPAAPTQSVAPQSTAPVSDPIVKAPPPLPMKEVVIDLVDLAARGFLTPNAPRSQIAEEYRIIKRPLISNAIGKNSALIDQGNLIMVTSATPGEGKTYNSINLAISIAMELDTTVMLVDADVAKPSVLKDLGLPPQPGLLDVLSEGSLDLSKVLLRTNIEKLTILPSGNQHLRATELLASDAMVRLLDDMANRYKDRIIIFDSPPMLLTTESRVLAAHMGQIVMVVGAEKTMQSQVKQALSMIESCPVKLLLLNRARAGLLDQYGYGYGHKYGYGYGYGQGQDQAANP